MSTPMKVVPKVILVVDDEPEIGKSLSGILGDEGHQTVCVHSGEAALEQLATGVSIDLVLLDIWLGRGMDGLATLQAIQQRPGHPPVVIMSGHGTIETAVKATKLGAQDFLEKPLDLEKILLILREITARKSAPSGSPSPEAVPMIGRSDVISALRRKINLIGPRHSWVLISGENGTGKEVVARNIHLNSLRAHHPFVVVNCAAIAENLIESELFGHARGAYPHALTPKKGRFELAHRGTLFLDEIGDMSLNVQAKILRILQEQCFEKLGSTETQKVDVRVLAATNKDLTAEIAAGRFREDLYYRLNVIPIQVPPLRARREDIPDLIVFFNQQIATDLGEPAKELSPAALDALAQCPWRGNVRELKNLLERLSVLVQGREIKPGHLPPEYRSGTAQLSAATPESFAQLANLREAKDAFERDFLLLKLRQHGGNISRTAAVIGLERSQLYRRLRTLGIDVKKGVEDSSGCEDETSS